MAQTCSTGPSKKAFSCALSRGWGELCNFVQSGLPRNSSASNQVVPASIACFSVSDICGIIFLNNFNNGILINCRRIMSIFNGRAMTANNNQETKPIVLKRVPIANNVINAKVKVESDALT